MHWGSHRSVGGHGIQHTHPPQKQGFSSPFPHPSPINTCLFCSTPSALFSACPHLERLADACKVLWHDERQHGRLLEHALCVLQAGNVGPANVGRPVHHVALQLAGQVGVGADVPGRRDGSGCEENVREKVKGCN
eukprot:107447-Chlamydomonas_euryale.AAC.1